MSAPSVRKKLGDLQLRLREALLVAIPGDAPSDVVDQLAIAVGMIDAVSHSESISLADLVADRGRRALGAFRKWRKRDGHAKPGGRPKPPPRRAPSRRSRT